MGDSIEVESTSIDRELAQGLVRYVTIAIDAINGVPKLQVAGAHIKEQLKNRQIECRQYA